MMEQKTDKQIDAELASFFEAAKDNQHIPSAGFMDAVLKDAIDQHDRCQRPTTKVTTNVFANILRNIGGWPAASAMTACVCIGLYAGYYAPDTMNYFSSAAITNETINDDSIYYDNASLALDIETLFQEG